MGSNCIALSALGKLDGNRSEFVYTASTSRVYAGKDDEKLEPGSSSTIVTALDSGAVHSHQTDPPCELQSWRKAIGQPAGSGQSSTVAPASVPVKLMDVPLKTV